MWSGVRLLAYHPPSGSAASHLAQLEQVVNSLCLNFLDSKMGMISPFLEESNELACLKNSEQCLAHDLHLIGVNYSSYF